jgi:single-stranded DNA-binding protein
MQCLSHGEALNQFQVTYVWGKLAQFAATLKKRAHIEVEGQLRYRTYQKQIEAGGRSSPST